MASLRALFPLSLVTLAATAAAYTRMALGPLQEAIRVAMGLSDNQIALVQGPMLAVPVVLAALPIGFLIDRYSRALLLVVFMALCAIGNGLTALTSSFVMLCAARGIAGLAATAATTTALSLLGDICPPEQRGRATMAIAIGQFGGISLAFALGGFLLAVPGMHTSWQNAMWGLTVPLLVVTLLMLLMREPSREVGTKNKVSASAELAELWSCRWLLLPLLGGVIFMELVLGGVIIWAGPSLARTFHATPAMMGSILATALLLSGVVGPFAGGVLADICQRIGGPRLTLLILSATSLVITPFAMFAAAPGLWIASALLGLFLTAVGAIAVIGTTLFTIVVPDRLRGICMAILAAASVIFGVGIAPISVSLVSSALGGGVHLSISLSGIGACGCICAGLSFALARGFVIAAANGA